MVSLRSLAFGATMFSSSALNNLFVTYYITYFTTVVGLTQRSFVIGQTVFMCWNAVNDVVFGWVSDHCCTHRTRRTDSIRWGGVIWALAFVALWFPLGAVLVPVQTLSLGKDVWTLREAIDCMHFLIVLCVYDGGLTFVEVNHSALLAELTSSPSARAECNMWCAVCAGVGALSSWAAYVSWDSSDLSFFRWTTGAVALVAWLVFEVSSRYLARFITKRRVSLDAETMVLPEDTPADTAVIERPLTPQHRPSARADTEKQESSDKEVDLRAKLDTPQTPWAFFWQLAHQRNFVVCVLLSALQVFDCTFEKNFFALSLDFLTGNALSPSTRGLIVSSSFILPHFCTVIVTPVIQKKGLFIALCVVFSCRLAILAVAGFAVVSPLVVATFMLINRVTSENVCRLTPLIVSDLTDEDTYINKRREPLSASIAGAAAFVPKFSQSLAPMLGLALVPISFTTPAEHRSFAEVVVAQGLLWNVLIAVPLVCVLCQLALWVSGYTLKGDYLKRVKLYTMHRSVV